MPRIDINDEDALSEYLTPDNNYKVIYIAETNELEITEKDGTQAY